MPHVPIVVGLDVRIAEQRLLARGYSVTVEKRQSSTSPAGTILAETPSTTADGHVSAVRLVEAIAPRTK
jgi:beta-lactam-binding protein with PASTA domain